MREYYMSAVFHWHELIKYIEFSSFPNYSFMDFAMKIHLEYERAHGSGDIFPQFHQLNASPSTFNILHIAFDFVYCLFDFLSVGSYTYHKFIQSTAYAIKIDFILEQQKAVNIKYYLSDIYVIILKYNDKIHSQV